MRTILYKPIFVNPLAYYVFPQLAVIQPTDELTEEYARYSGYIRVYNTLEPEDYVLFDHTNFIDFEGFGEEMIDIDQYTDRGAVKLGRWLLPAIGDWIVDEIRWYDHMPESVDDPDYIVDYDYFAINDGVLDLYGVIVLHLYTEDGKTDKVRFAPIVDSIEITQIEDGVEILEQEVGPNYIHLILSIPGQGYQYEAKEVPLITVTVIDDTKTVIVDGEATEEYIEYTQSIDHIYKVTIADYQPHTDSDEYKLRIEYEGVPIAAEGHYQNAADATLHFFLDQWLSVDNGSTWERFTGYVFDFSLIDTAQIESISSWLNLVAITENSVEDGWVEYSVFNFEADLNAGQARTGTAEISYSWTKPEDENIHTCKYPGVDYLEFSQVFELELLGGAIPNEIRNALLLWYDIERQGVTNESMAENPTLIDQSGNGYDATCSNFAWSGMSGIGGYNYDFSAWVCDGVFNQGVIVTQTQNKLIYESFGNRAKGNIAYKYLGVTTTIPKLDIMLNNIQGLNLIANVSYKPTGGGYVTVLNFKMHEGHNEIPETNIGADISTIENVVVRFEMLSNSDTNLTVPFTIEQLPLYPNALVSDGVDDYAQVTGLPLLTKENGYTVIAKRKYISGNQFSCLASKYLDGNTNGAFNFELKYLSDIDSFSHALSFGALTDVRDYIPSTVSYMTSNNYNNRVALSQGDNADGTNLCFFRLRSDNAYCMSAALYSFILFQRDLTEDEIKWVKENMLNYHMEDEIKDSMIIHYDVEKQGCTNENMKANPILRDLSGNGHDANCNNFAWSEISGIGKWPFDLNEILYDKVSYNKFHVNLDSQYATTIKTTNDISFRFRISNYDGNGRTGFTVRILTNNNQTIVKTETFASDGEYLYAYKSEDGSNFNLIIYNINPSVGLIDVSYDLEILPEYPNALVSDGVDDITQAAGFTLGKDWTLMFDADYISEDNITAGIVKNNRVYVYDGGRSNTIGIFINETNNYTAQIGKERNPYCISSNDKIYLKDGTVITTQSSQNSANIVSDSPLRTHGFNNHYAKIALRKLLLFDRVLTQEEVNWATVNLLGRTLYNAPEFNIDFSKVNNGVSSFTDLTGNHTINLYNFAGSGMSGRDGYAANYNTNNSLVTSNGNSFHIKGIINSVLWGFSFDCTTNEYPEYKVNITGITSDNHLLYYYINETGVRTFIKLTNGENILPKSQIGKDEGTTICGFYLTGNTTGNEVDITVEQLPLYEGAYVFDGVDDYMKFADLNHGVKTLYMIVNPFKGSTILYNQRTNIEILNDDFAIYNELGGRIAYSARNSGDTYINGVLNTTLTSADLLNKKHLITIVNNADTIGQEIGSIDIGQFGLAYYANMACYKLIGFNEVHTEELIQQVIKDYNLMEGIE